MSELSKALRNLFDLLVRWDVSPPTWDIRVIEIGSDTPLDAAGRPRIARAGLLRPNEYEHRFDELMGSGLPWINVSCCGVDGGKLLVVVETSKPVAKPITLTSVNYSGPSRAVLARAWSVDEILVIE